MSFLPSEFFKSVLSGLTYLPGTLLLAVVPILIGLVFGGLIAVARVFQVPVLAKVLAVFVTLYTGVPFIVSLLIYNLIFMTQFNGIAAFFHLNLTVGDVSPVWVAYFALSLMEITYMSESLRGALLAVDKGQYEAGYSVGLTTVQTLQRIVLPQMIPVAIPMLTNNIVGVIKASSIVMVIGVMDVLNGALVPCHLTYRFLEGYVAAAAIYWGLTILVESGARFLEKRQDKYRRQVA